MVFSVIKKILFFLFIFTFNFKVQAKKTTIIADADIVEKNTLKEIILLKGHVNVIFKQQHLLCDEAIIDEKNNHITAKGNVILKNARTTLRSERLELNYKTNKGKLYKGVITSGRTLFQADLIEKVGKDEYVADKAYYTACLTCPASWGFTSSRIKAKIGDYAIIHNPWLYLLELPTLPLPYLVIPLNAKRRTGFLVPRVSSNTDNGLTLEQPFYWAINHSSDATFSLINYEKRGLQAFGNYRYILSPTSSGELNASFLRDRSTGHRKRWFTEYKHFLDFSKNYIQRTEIALVTDQTFVIDFPKQLNYTGYPALENSLSLSKAMENSLLTIDTSYYVSLIEPEIDLLDENDSLHRMPEINFNMTDRKISEKLNLFSNLKFQYLNTTRYRGQAFEKTKKGEDQCVTIINKEKQDICYINATKNDKFIYGKNDKNPPDPDGERDYGDLIRTGQRFDLVSGFHSPFWLGSKFSVDPFLNLRLTQYSLGVSSDSSQGYNSTPHRFYTQLGFSAKTYAHRVFQWNKDTKIKHSIIPRIDLQYIPRIYQSDHHFFGTQKHLKYFREQQPIDDTDADWRNGGRGIQFDQNDRVIGQRLLNFSITNKIFSRSVLSDNTESYKNTYKKNLHFQVSQAFDLNEAAKKHHSQPWQDTRLYTFFNTGPFSQSVQTSYFPYHRRFLWQTATHYAFIPKNFISLAYTKNYMINNEPPVDDRTKDELLLLGTSFNFEYFYLYGVLEYDLTARRELGEDNFKRWSITARLTPPGSCWFIKGNIENRLDIGIVNYSISMQFAFSQ